jgi:hypothetical protein
MLDISIGSTFVYYEKGCYDHSFANLYMDKFSLSWLYI